MMLDRRIDKRRVLWNGKLHRDGYILECEIFDISAEGAKVRSIEHLAINSTVILEIDRLGMFPGEIRWQPADHTGIRFLESACTIEVRLGGAAVPLAGE
jgi:hypothetical protein